MEPKGKLANNCENALWESIDEQDVMQLRGKLNEIWVLTENQLQSYNMNSSGDVDTIM